MELKEAMIKRRSVRSFSETLVPRELIKEIIDVTRYYPSWKNSQTARFYAIDNVEIKNRVADEATFGKGNNQRIIRSSPCLIVQTIKKGLSGTDANGEYMTSKGSEWEVYDSGLAGQSFCLSAFDKGVGSVILGIFKEEVVASICNIPSDEKVSALIPIGYPEEPVTREGVRKEVDEILKF